MLTQELLSLFSEVILNSKMYVKIVNILGDILLCVDINCVYAYAYLNHMLVCVQLKVLPKDLQLCADMATGVDSLGQFQFGDLVHIE